MVNGLLNGLQRALFLWRVKYGEWKFIRTKKKFYESVEWDATRQAEYEAFWTKHYGEIFPTHWHKMYEALNGAYCVDYMPDMLYSTKLEPLLNPTAYSQVFSDKSLQPLLYGSVEGVRFPRTLVLNNNGLFSDGSHKLLSLAEAAETLQNAGPTVWKAIIGSCGGKSLELTDIRDGVDQKSGTPVLELLLRYGKNFVVQERILPSAELKQVGPKSLNTFRVITFVAGDHIGHAPLALRMGVADMEVDNLSSGGLCVGVDDAGNLKETAFHIGHQESDYGMVSFTEHPDTGVTFAGLRIPQVPQLIAAAEQMHSLTPQVGIISWDLSVSEAGEIIVVEANYCDQSMWFPQIANGRPIFGADMPYILGLIRRKK